MNADFRLSHHGTISLLQPSTQEGVRWIEDKLSHGIFWIGAVAIEHRFIDDIVTGIARDGLTIGTDVRPAEVR